MDENDIAEVNKFIDELIDVLDAFFKEYESLSDPALKLSFLESNLAIFGYFKDSLFLILLNYLNFLLQFHYLVHLLQQCCRHLLLLLHLP